MRNLTPLLLSCFGSLSHALEAQLCFLQPLMWSQESAVFMSLGSNPSSTTNGGTFSKTTHHDEP